MPIDILTDNDAHCQSEPSKEVFIPKVFVIIDVCFTKYCLVWFLVRCIQTQNISNTRRCLFQRPSHPSSKLNHICDKQSNNASLMVFLSWSLPCVMICVLPFSNVTTASSSFCQEVNNMVVNPCL